MIYYYINDCGDGSALLRTCETEELANYLDENQSQPFGDSTVGYIDATPNPGFKFNETRFSVLIDLLENIDSSHFKNLITKYIEQFYPNGVKFSHIRSEPVDLPKSPIKYTYEVFKLGGQEIKIFTRSKEELLEKFKEYLE